MATEYISLSEVRRDLTGFLRSVNNGKNFAVYRRAKIMARIGRVGEAGRLGVNLDELQLIDNTNRTELFNNWLDLMEQIRLELRLHRGDWS